MTLEQKKNCIKTLLSENLSHAKISRRLGVSQKCANNVENHKIRCPYRNKFQIKKSLNWCKRYANWTEMVCNKIIYSDESHFELNVKNYHLFDVQCFK